MRWNRSRFSLWVIGVGAALILGGCQEEKSARTTGLSDDCGDLPAPSTLQLTIQDGAYLDALGRRVLLRGVNAGGRSKYPPFFPFAFQESGYSGQETAPPFDDAVKAYVENVVEWGHNVVRLPFSWEAVEPEKGQYDTEFIARLNTMISTFGMHDIRVILEFHQDVFARTYCGDGFPLWATSDPDRPIPAVEDCAQWFQAYLNKNNEVAEEFRRFWMNEDGLQDALLEMWRVMLTATQDHDNLIGVEVMNEPWEGSLETQDWAENYMKPLVERFADAVEEIRPELLVFFGSAGTDTLSGNTVVSLPDRPDMSFAPHFYDPVVYVAGTKSKNWNPRRVLDNFFASAQEWNVPILIGETGCKTAIAHCDLYTRDTFNAYDHYPMHATAWEYSTTEDDWNNEGYRLTGPGGEESAAIDETVRVYPAALAANNQRFSYDRKTDLAEFDLDVHAHGWSEIVVPARRYPEGFRVRADGVPICATYDTDAQRLFVRTDADGPLHLTLEPLP